MKVVAALLFLAACAYGQELCGINSDCACRTSCMPSERQSDIDSCASGICCCPNVQCGIWWDCNCRENCLSNEYEGTITDCSQAQPSGMKCCCPNDRFAQMVGRRGQ